MPPRLAHRSVSPVALNRLAAGLALTAAVSVPTFAAGPQDTPEGIVHAGDRPAFVVPVAAQSAPAAPSSASSGSVPTGSASSGSVASAPVRTWSGPEQIVPGSERVVGGLPQGVVHGGVSHGVHGGGTTEYVSVPHDCRFRDSRRRAALRDVIPPPLAGYDAYLPPDHGWQMPIAYPVQRQTLPYTNYYPHQWYGLPGSQKQRVAPHVFMPTDTTQLGYYHQHVPTWQPPRPGVFPAAPDPRTMHHTAQAGGPEIGTYPGIYPGEIRRGGSVHDPVTGQSIPQGGVTYGAPQGVTYGAPIQSGPVVTQPVPAAPAPSMDVEPLPSSTEPLPPADDPPGAPVPSDAVAPPAVEV